MKANSVKGSNAISTILSFIAVALMGLAFLYLIVVFPVVLAEKMTTMTKWEECPRVGRYVPIAPIILVYDNDTVAVMRNWTDCVIHLNGTAVGSKSGSLFQLSVRVAVVCVKYGPRI